MFPNKFRVLAAIVPASAILLYAPARASTLELEPSSQWVLDSAEDSCALRRMFGEGDMSGLLEIRKFAPTSALEVTVSSNGSRTTKHPFEYRFLPIQQWQDDDGTFYVAHKNGFRGGMFSTELSKIDEVKEADAGSVRVVNIQDYRDKELDAGAKITSLEIRGMFKQPIMLKTGSLQAPISTMQKCIDELMTHWGLDAEAQKTVQRPAILKIRFRLGFPESIARAGVPALVHLRLDIGPAGDVTGCHIQLPLRDPAYVKSVCAGLKRDLTFEPAIDKDGKPIASYWTERILYKMHD